MFKNKFFTMFILYIRVLIIKRICHVLLECFHKVYYFYDIYVCDKYKIETYTCKEIIYVFF